MIKVTLCRSYSKNCWWSVNRKHKGPFIREFKNISDLALFLHKTRRIFLLKSEEELSLSQRISLTHKLRSLEGKRRLIPSYPEERMVEEIVKMNQVVS